MSLNAGGLVNCNSRQADFSDFESFAFSHRTLHVSRSVVEQHQSAQLTLLAEEKVERGCELHGVLVLLREVHYDAVPGTIKLHWQCIAGPRRRPELSSARLGGVGGRSLPREPRAGNGFGLGLSLCEVCATSAQRQALIGAAERFGSPERV